MDSTGAVSVAAYMIIGPVLVLVNKFLLGQVHFAYPMFLSGLGLAFAGVVAHIALATKYLQLSKECDARIKDVPFWITKVMPVGAMQAATLAFGECVLFVLFVCLFVVVAAVSSFIFVVAAAVVVVLSMLSLLLLWPHELKVERVCVGVCMHLKEEGAQLRVCCCHNHTQNTPAARSVPLHPHPLSAGSHVFQTSQTNASSIRVVSPLSRQCAVSTLWGRHHSDAQGHHPACGVCHSVLSSR